MFRIINYQSFKKHFLFIVRGPLFNHNGKLNFRNGRQEPSAIHEELLKGMELSEIEKKEMLKRLEKNASNETNKQHNAKGTSYSSIIQNYNPYHFTLQKFVGIACSLCSIDTPMNRSIKDWGIP